MTVRLVEREEEPTNYFVFLISQKDYFYFDYIFCNETSCNLFTAKWMMIQVSFTPSQWTFLRSTRSERSSENIFTESPKFIRNENAYPTVLFFPTVFFLYTKESKIISKLLHFKQKQHLFRFTFFFFVNFHSKLLEFSEFIKKFTIILLDSLFST